MPSTNAGERPRRLKILLSAYACEPGLGSEPAVGWQWARGLSRHHDVWVLTRTANRRAIEGHSGALEDGAPRWRYYDLPRWARFWKRGRRGVHLYYLLWQMGAYVAARRLHREVAFDLVHHVTFVNFWMPTFMAFLPAPFVWGPVGGGESIPAHLWATLGWRGRIYEALRMVARWVGECLPVVRITARQAAVAIASTPETAERLRRAGADRVFQLSQVGLSDEEIARLGQIPWRRYSPFRVMSVGSLLHLKGPQLGLRAFARLRNQLADCEYWIVGEGPDRSSLEALAARLGVSAAVRFLGLRSREEVLALLGECDVLLHPALHDSGGFACAEAMAAGRPVVCLDTGGPALQVQDGTGVRVPTGHPDTLVNAFADALLSLSRDPEARRTMGERARKIIAQYARWRVKVVEMEILYSRALGEDPVVITEGGSSQWDRPPRRSRHVKPQAIS